MNTEILKGNWNITKGKLKGKYAQLTDNDLIYIEGQEDQLLGHIQKKTGESREELEKFLNEDCACTFPERKHADRGNDQRGGGTAGRNR